ncbi:hypothetical protein CspHIS471_0204400 [Cutaneotrichosporon sp. HIS471]|nr:hypothetical protein CspHIS471_0204400 [Cutaneotrichosporon sp. HIS471]
MNPKIPRISLGGSEVPSVRVGDEPIYPSGATTSPDLSSESGAVANDANANAKLAALATRLETIEAKVAALHVKLDAIIDHLGVDRD